MSAMPAPARDVQFVPFEQRAFLTVQQAVQFSGTTKTRIYAALKEGRIAARKLGKRTLIDRRSLVAFLENNSAPYRFDEPLIRREQRDASSEAR